MSKRDFYDILGVSKKASAPELKKAYRTLARKWHPDRNKADNASQRFSEVQEAYDTLSDEKKRSAYDQFGHAGPAGGFPAGAGGSGSPFGGQAYTWSSPAPGDFASGGADIGSIFEGLFGQGRRQGRSAGRPRAQQAPPRGTDVAHTIEVPFQTGIAGGKQTLRLSLGDQTQSIDVTIPKGVADGAKLRLRGKGAPSQFGGADGDLILTIKIATHPWFRRDDLNISIDLPITIAEAVNGVTIDVPTPLSTVSMRIPPGTASGSRLRITGHGVEDGKGNKGDFFAVVSVQTPSDLTDEQQQFFDKLGESLPSPRTQKPWQ